MSEDVRTREWANNGPGALRRALFQDVPYILDSLWRWTEFRANRIGTVEFTGEHRFILRPAWQSGAFVLWIMLCTFAIFGPTWDAWCSLRGFGFATDVRKYVSLVLLVIAAVIFTRVLNAVTLHLTRRAESLAVRRPAEPANGHNPFKSIAETQIKVERRFENVRVAIDRRTQETVGNLNRFFAALPKVDKSEAWALVLGLLMLMVGALMVVAPIIATAYGLQHGESDAHSCSRLDHPGLVVAQFAALLLSVGGGWALWRRLGSAKTFAMCVLLTLLLGAIIAALWLWFTPAKPSEAAGGFYPHLYLILVACLLFIAIASKWLAHALFANFEGSRGFRDALATEDLLHNVRTPPDISGLRLASALVNGVVSHPMHFMLLPSLVIFIAPSSWVWPLFWSFLFVSAMLLMYGSLSTRWEQMLVYVERWFLVGTPLVMSMGVIVLAGLRLANVQYVATVLDATPIGVLFICIVMMYVAFWFFEYWLNRWVGEELLGYLCGAGESCHCYVPVHFQPAPDEKPWASVDGRYVALHGTGRFIAQGWFKRENPAPGEPELQEAFTTYGFVELFDVLGARVPDGIELARDIRRRVHLYFALINIALVATAFGLVKWHDNWARPLAVEPMVRASAIKPELKSDVELGAQARIQGDALGLELLGQTKLGRPSLIVAASGGGTRAAVYTAVALEGLGEINRARDVVLLSGVSGGGVSAAVFASRFAQLQVAPPHAETPEHPGPWSNYIATVSEPFIQDVLEGIGELRISGSSSLGVLLEESLERRAFSDDETRIQTFAGLKDPALILNTAISGHPYNDSQLLRGRVAAPPADGSCVEKSRPYANLSGGRLIFTNLTNLTGFPERATDVPDMWLPYRIVTDGSVKLAQASALTANFPPVFSNARVRLTTDEVQGCEGQSYFVTDGGATENLGLVSALFALRGTLAQLPEDSHLTDIHVLAFEASAIDYDYSDDRGIGAATGGSKERINAGLTQVLIKELTALAGSRGAAFKVHYLPLPVAFRSRGGFGTHWMFARNVEVTNPLLAAAPSWFKSVKNGDAIRDEVELNRQEVMTTWRALFDPKDPICERAARIHGDPKSAPKTWSNDVQRVARWICGNDDARNTAPVLPDYQVEAWSQTVRDLAPREQTRQFEPYSKSTTKD